MTATVWHTVPGTASFLDDEKRYQARCEECGWRGTKLSIEGYAATEATKHNADRGHFQANVRSGDLGDLIPYFEPKEITS